MRWLVIHFIKSAGGLSLSILACLLFTVRPAAAEEDLRNEISLIKDRLSGLESNPGHPSVEKGAGWYDRFDFSGLLEVEGGVRQSDSTTESDVTVATVELDLAAEMSNYSSAHLLLLYEDGQDGLDLDQATLTIGNPEKFPLFLSVGKMYVPFGNFATRMISDPLTQDVFETRGEAAQLAVKKGPFSASAYAFNGDVDDGGNDVIEHYGFDASYIFETATASCAIGGGWINNIRDSDGLTEALGGGPATVADYVGGYGAHLLAAFGRANLSGEYMTAEDDLNGPESRISAYQIEAGISFPVLDRDASIAVGFQATDQAADIFPEERVMAAVAVQVLKGISLALEWFRETDYSAADGGTGTSADVYTLQLAAGF
jgi:hypothetical protein